MADVSSVIPFGIGSTVVNHDTCKRILKTKPIFNQLRVYLLSFEWLLIINEF